MRRKRRSFGNDAEIGKGLVSGLVGGLVASWTMNNFLEASARAAQALQSRRRPGQQQAGRPDQSQVQAEQQSQVQREKQQPAQDSEDATMKAVNRLYQAVRHRELSPEQKKKAGPIVHYAYGALAGGFYGGLAELAPKTRLAAGGAFGTALWAAGDEIAVPLLGLSKPPREYPLSTHANALAAHLVYGLTTEMVRRGLRRAWAQ